MESDRTFCIQGPKPNVNRQEATDLVCQYYSGKLGETCVRMDVIDSPPKARGLYERRGFSPVSVAKIGPLSHIFGSRTAKASRFNVIQADEMKP